MSPGNDGFVAVAELTKMLKIHPNATRRRLKIAGIEVYSDPHDRRRRLIRLDDLPMMTQPLPISREEKGGKPAVITG